MKKCAVFVEGNAELILVREYLLRMFEYQNIAINCFILQNSKLCYEEYDYGDVCFVDNYFMVVNVGNDNKVLSQMMSRAKKLLSSGYSKIIGLRDVYSQVYRSENKGQRTIDIDIINKFKSRSQDYIDSFGMNDKIHLFFAVMEIESWILGFDDIFLSKDRRLTNDFIEEKLSFNLKKIDPEYFFYHPARAIGDIFGLIGEKYDKHESDVSCLINSLSRENYIELLNSGKCKSFKDFSFGLFEDFIIKS